MVGLRRIPASPHNAVVGGAEAGDMYEVLQLSPEHFVERQAVALALARAHVDRLRPGGDMDWTGDEERRGHVMQLAEDALHQACLELLARAVPSRARSQPLQALGEGQLQSAR